MNIGHVVIAVPARNEADRITACLDSIVTALGHPDLADVSAHVVVGADSCTDDTEAVVAATAADDQRISVVSGEWRSAGRARAEATRLGLERCDAEARAQTWIATTDADSAVPPDWLAQQLRLATDGWVGVAGIVRLIGDETPSVHAHFTRTYETSPLGHHPHVHGANLGIRADAYDHIGGWAPLPLAEDHATWKRLVAAGFPVVSSTASWVWTSGRTVGRAAGGFADTLAGLVRGA